MKKNIAHRAVHLLLALVLCISLFASAAIAAEEPEEDIAAFGALSSSIQAQTREAWTNDALAPSEMEALLNRQTLHPQRTGWMELDNLLDQMLQNAGSDTYSKLRYMYDWLVKNVTYSWEGYSNTSASAAAYDSVTGYNYLYNMHYDGFAKTIPDDMANRTYHIFAAKRGVCYDYAIAMAVVARYVGIEAYVYTGRFIFEDSYNGAGHHGWAILELDGSRYIFDPQRDARNYEYHGRNGYYFGIPSSRSSRYQPDYWSADTRANADRNASLLPVTTDRGDTALITVATEGTGTVSGDGSYYIGSPVTLTATPAAGAHFGGWYDESDNLLSSSTSYTFTASTDQTITAKFVVTLEAFASRSGTVFGAGDYVVGSSATLTAQPKDHVSFDGWYDIDGNLLSTERTYYCTLTEDTQIYALFGGDRFYDIPVNAWYEEDVMEAVDLGLVEGVTPISFCGDMNFSRAMAVVMLARLDGADIANAPASNFEDVDEGAWFADAINWAADASLVLGKDETHFMPDDPIKREEFVAIMVRYLEYKGITLEPQALTYTDVDEIDEYALEYLQKAQSIDLIQGDPGGTFRPRDTLLRSEGATVMVRLTHYLNSNG